MERSLSRACDKTDMLTRQASGRLTDAANRQYPMGSATFGLTLVALTSVAVQSFPKLSTACTNGTRVQRYVMRSCQTLSHDQASKSVLRSPKSIRAVRTLHILSISQAAVGSPVKRFEPETWSVAQRTSWTSGRRTTRIEDRAYSLLGIFQVNMPLLYGEGSRAFQRLQEEIMKVSNDISIFAWLEGADKSFGMLAGSPDSFTATPGYNCFLAADDEYSLSKTGLSGSFYLIPHASNIVVAPLGSYTKHAADSALIRVSSGIFLRQQPESCYKPVTVNGQRCIFTRGAWDDPTKIQVDRCQIEDRDSHHTRLHRDLGILADHSSPVIQPGALRGLHLSREQAINVSHTIYTEYDLVRIPLMISGDNTGCLYIDSNPGWVIYWTREYSRGPVDFASKTITRRQAKAFEDAWEEPCLLRSRLCYATRYQYQQFPQYYRSIL